MKLSQLNEEIIDEKRLKDLAKKVGRGLAGTALAGAALTGAGSYVMGADDAGKTYPGEEIASMVQKGKEFFTGGDKEKPAEVTQQAEKSEIEQTVEQSKKDPKRDIIIKLGPVTHKYATNIRHSRDTNIQSATRSKRDLEHVMHKLMDGELKNTDEAINYMVKKLNYTGDTFKKYESNIRKLFDASVTLHGQY